MSQNPELTQIDATTLLTTFNTFLQLEFAQLQPTLLMAQHTVTNDVESHVNTVYTCLLFSLCRVFMYIEFLKDTGMTITTRLDYKWLGAAC